MDVQRLSNLRDSLERGVTESLALEIKEWIDPDDAHGKAKIVKGCFALRNNNGGDLVVGIKDQTGEVVAPPNGFDPRQKFTVDKIQELIGKYASEPFPIEVNFILIDGVSCPVVTVPHGVRTPVVAKADLEIAKSNRGDTRLIKDNAVYVRSITANNRVSSSEILKGDWPRLMETCFENRESDVASFVRRHLADLFDPNLVKARATTNEALDNVTTLEKFKSFLELVSERATPLNPKDGLREFAVTVRGDRSFIPVPNRDLLSRLSINAPRMSGWNPWAILLGGDASARPYVVKGAWECFLDFYKGGITSRHLDYWWFHPKGEFYHVRVVEDDLLSDSRVRIKPHSVLDWVLQIARVTEAIVVVKTMIKDLGFDQTATMTFTARWQNLKGRQLMSWAQPQRHSASWGKAHDNDFAWTVNIPIDVLDSDLIQYVRPIIDNLFALFEFDSLEDSVFQSIIQQTLARDWS